MTLSQLFLDLVRTGLLPKCWVEANRIPGQTHLNLGQQNVQKTIVVPARSQELLRWNLSDSPLSSQHSDADFVRPSLDAFALQPAGKALEKSDCLAYPWRAKRQTGRARER